MTWKKSTFWKNASPTELLQFFRTIDAKVYFLRIRNLFNSNQSLRILSLSEEMDRDPTLKIHLLANLDPTTWEAYFNLLEEKKLTMQTLLGIFVNLREKEFRKILLNSPTVFYYLRMMMMSREYSTADEREVQNREKLEIILEFIHVWEIFCNELKVKFDFNSEKKLIPSKRNPDRLSRVLRELIKVPGSFRYFGLYQGKWGTARQLGRNYSFFSFDEF